MGNACVVQMQNRETQVDTLPSPIPAPPPVQQQIIQLPAQQPIIEEHAFKQTTTKRRIDNDALTDDDDDFIGKVGGYHLEELVLLTDFT